MEPNLIRPFLRRAAATDPRILPGDEEEAFAATALWAVALADVPFEFAVNAIAEHSARSPYQVRPSDITDLWRRHSASALAPYVDPLPAADPDDPAAYAAELRAGRAAAATAGEAPTVRQALGPGRYEIAATSYEEEDLAAMRMEGDLKRMWAGVGKQALDENDRRRLLVLAHDDLAAKLGEAPINIKPECWSGFVPMERGVNGLNRSPVRRALAALVAEAERRAA